MGDRALAHVEKVVSTYAIEGADKIEMTQVLDFHVVTEKGQFKPGDLVIYVEIDAILPDGLSLELQSEYTNTKKKLKAATGDSIAELELQLKNITLKSKRPEFEHLRERLKNFRIKAKSYTKFKIISQGIIFPLSILESVGEIINKGDEIHFKTEIR